MLAAVLALASLYPTLGAAGPTSASPTAAPASASPAATPTSASPAAPATSPSATPTPRLLVVHGTLLTVERGYLVFTTGDAVRLGDVAIPKGALLGRQVRATIDSASRLVVGVELDPQGTLPQEIDAGALPRDVVIVDPPSAQSAPEVAAQSLGRPVTLTLDVTVPDDTPPTDTIYLSTDRTNFNPSELRLNRVDAYRWTIALPLLSGTALHYQYTRGTSATVERTGSGALLVPRIQTLSSDGGSHDVVARWADRT